MSAKPVWLQPPPASDNIKQQNNTVKDNVVGTQNAVTSGLLPEILFLGKA